MAAFFEILFEWRGVVLALTFRAPFHPSISQRHWAGNKRIGPNWLPPLNGPCHVESNNAMKSILASIALILALAALNNATAQGANSTNRTKAAVPQNNGNKSAATANQLEAKFKTTLTKATMSGRWCALKDGRLGPENEDKYTIVSVMKLGGDSWIINTRIQYNNKDMIAPIPVQVKWAGDTAVIIVDKIPVPGGGTYSARVLVYENTYAGSWSGGDHGGLLNGVITPSRN